MKNYSRTLPYHSWIKERELITGHSSSKKTYHIVLDTSNWHESYKVGDSVGILPANDLREVEFILKGMDAKGSELVLDHRSNETLPIRDFLMHRANLAKVNRSFISLLNEKGSGDLIRSLLDVENKEKLTAFIHSHTLLQLIHYAPITPSELAKVVMPLLPRFYSITNSAKVFAGEIHLLIAYVHYQIKEEARYGVGSRFLCDLAEIGSTPIPLYVQPSHHFTLPMDPSSSMIMVGPGTGVAPYRAFLQERIASHSTGRNWLFFGERNRKSDFYYEDFWTDLEKQGSLRLDVAFSRDQNEKSYVQHKMYERRKAFWQWIQEGAFIYVCGDAEKMAKEVDAVICQIVKEEGGYSEEDANRYVKKMRQDKRYLIDVY
jgi:sulfite reductase (NADPH) flavoprotein alpha-component